MHTWKSSALTFTGLLIFTSALALMSPAVGYAQPDVGPVFGSQAQPIPAAIFSLSGTLESALGMPRIGLLTLGSAQSPVVSRAVEALREGLRELGYVEGQTIAIEYRYAEGMFQRLSDLAGELVDLRVDLIVTAEDPATFAVKRTATTLPIVMVTSRDPVGDGLIASFARPGGNITGLALLSPDLSGKRLEVFQEILPRPSRVAVLWNPVNLLNALSWKEMQAAAPASDITLQSLEVRGPRDLDRALSAVAAARPDGVVALADPLIAHQIGTLTDFAAKNQLPVMAEAREHANAGALMAYSVSHPDLFRRSAGYVSKILKGARPADLPLEPPTKFELVINLKTAKALGLTIPQSLLRRADEVIQ